LSTNRRTVWRHSRNGKKLGRGKKSSKKKLPARWSDANEKARSANKIGEGHGSSYFKLPKVLQWFTGNIGLHHIHHVRPTIPNYNLQRCYNEVPALQAVKAITLKASIRSLRLSLYDEKSKKLVGFSCVANN